MQNGPREREKRVWMTLAGDYKKCGCALMQQQCWCWGTDVRREVGGVRQNLLLEMGFVRRRPPEGVAGASTYTRDDDGTRVHLWGFGMAYGNSERAIFISRFAFWPRVGDIFTLPPVWSPKQLDEQFRAPKRAEECAAAISLFGEALRWIARYESAVEAVCGQEYRVQSLTGWGHTRVGTGSIASQWEKLAEKAPQTARFWATKSGKKCEIPFEQLSLL